MQRNVKYTLIAVPALVAIIGLGVVRLAEWRLGRTYDDPLADISVPVTADLAVEGARLARVFGCSGCHKQAGSVLFDQANVGRLIAPNLTQVAASYTDAELARLIRKGVKRDGTSVIAMPTAALTHISDDDLAAIISWLRGQPVVEDAQDMETQWRALGLLGLALNKVLLGADGNHDLAPPLVRNRDGAVVEGQYLTSVTCRACHDLHVTTDNGFGMVTPPLVAMARAYSLEDFQTLLTKGEALGDREVGLMSVTARDDLAAMTGAEQRAVYLYLQGGADEKLDYVADSSCIPTKSACACPSLNDLEQPR